MKVWLIGARGLLGQAMHREIELRDVTLVATDVDVDIRDADVVSRLVARERPSHVVNCAAYTRVDDAEKDEEVALALNGHAVGNLARACAEHGSLLLHFSTDYVFDGRSELPYPEDAPRAPLGAYGRTKLAGERQLELTPGLLWHCVRTSWLFGEGGANFVATMLGLMATRDRLQVVVDQRGRPTYARDLARAALDLAGIDAGLSPAPPGTYHFANAGAVSWYELATRIHERARAIELPVRTERIDPVSSDEFPRPAPRPASSVLDTSKFSRTLGRTPREYTLALEEYLERFAETTEGALA